MTRAVSPDSGLDLERTETVRQLAEQHASERGALMVVLHAVQSELGHIGRSDVETIADVLNLSIAAVVTEVLPDGNLLITGTQEVRVNHEVRVLNIAGIVRPLDIAKDNVISYEKIAEARISYGGRGKISAVQ